MILKRLRRSFDVARFNELANHDAIRPWIGGKGVLDLAPMVMEPTNVCLLNEHGGFLCHRLDVGLYEVHSMMLPEGRGENTIECVREGFRYMFCATDCVEIITKCPDGNGAALGIARAAGFQEIFRRERAWDNGGLEAVGISYQSISFARWRNRDLELTKWGKWFHDKLEAAKLEQGSELPIHDDDEAHDRAVGASVLMAMSGNPRKAVATYNRWAVFAGYAPIFLASEAPVLIDVVDAVVAPKGADMEVVLCRLAR